MFICVAGRCKVPINTVVSNVDLEERLEVKGNWRHSNYQGRDVGHRGGGSLLCLGPASLRDIVLSLVIFR